VLIFDFLECWVLHPKLCFIISYDVISIDIFKKKSKEGLMIESEWSWVRSPMAVCSKYPS